MELTGNALNELLFKKAGKTWDAVVEEGTPPEGLDAVALKGHHVSRPRNPLIDDVCFKAGYMDA